MLAARSLSRAFLAVLASATAAAAATLPAGFSETRLATGLSNPTAMSVAPDGRIFICQQGGQLRVVKNGSLLGTPFLTVSVDPSGERGLLGVTFDPAFATNRFIYIYYTVPTAPIHNRVSRFTASATNPDVVMAGSEVPILDLPNLSSATNQRRRYPLRPRRQALRAARMRTRPTRRRSTPPPAVLRINPTAPFLAQPSSARRWPPTRRSGRGLRNLHVAFQLVRPPAHQRRRRARGRVTWGGGGLPRLAVHRGAEPPGQAGVTYPTFAFQHTAASAPSGVLSTTCHRDSAGVRRPYFGDLCAGFIHTLSPRHTTVWELRDRDQLARRPGCRDRRRPVYLARGGGELFRVQPAPTPRRRSPPRT